MENKHLISFIYKNDKLLYPFEKLLFQTSDKQIIDEIKFKFGFIPILLNKSSPSKYGILIKILTEEKIEKDNSVIHSFSIIGSLRFRIIKIIEDSDKRKALVEYIDDSISSKLESKLNNSSMIIKLKDISILYFNRKETNRINELTKNNLIWYENNIIRLCFILMGLVICDLELKILFLNINTVEERIIFLIKYFDNELKKPIIEKDKIEIWDLDKKENLLKIKEDYLKLKLNKEVKLCIIEYLDKFIQNKEKNQEIDNKIEKNYLTYLLKIPWNIYSKELHSISEVKKLLDKKYYGLKKVKQRVLEYLAIRIVNGKNMPVICLNGPPGVGKTSISKIIAKVLNKKYYKQSLSGIKDESLIIGTSRYYVGAYPGIIIDSLISTKTMNPLVLLDEIDKINQNFKGNPSFPLLEILDNKQNKYFKDHYMNLPINISNIFFVLTCNSIANIHPTLLDRLEIINIEGYSIKDKIEICKNYLIKKIIKNHGMKEKYYTYDIETIENIIINYTNEVGLRELVRCIDKIIRFSIIKFLENGKKDNFKFNINNEIVKFLLNSFNKNNSDQIDQSNNIGIVKYLKYISFRYELCYVEAELWDYKHCLIETIGNSSKFIKDKILLAYNWIKININKEFSDHLDNKKIILNFPDLNNDLDNLNNGVSILIVILSLVFKIPVENNSIFIGDITLKGNILKLKNIKKRFNWNINNKNLKIFIPVSNKDEFNEIKYKDYWNLYYIDNIKELIKLIFNKDNTIFKEFNKNSDLIKL